RAEGHADRAPLHRRRSRPPRRASREARLDLRARAHPRRARGEHRVRAGRGAWPRGGGARRLGARRIELLVVTKDPVLVEWDAPRRAEVARDARAPPYPPTQGEEARDARALSAKGAGEGVREPLEELKEREVDVRALFAEEPRALAPREDVLEVPEEARPALAREDRAGPPGRVPLILVVERRRDGVVRGVGLVDDVDDREHVLKRGEARGPLGRGEPVTLAEIGADRRRLRQDELAVDEEGRRERERAVVPALHVFEELPDASAACR